MQISIEVNEDTMSYLQDMAKEIQTDVADAAALLLTKAAQNQISWEYHSIEKKIECLLEQSINSRALLLEVLNMVFDAKKSRLGAQDVDEVMDTIESLSYKASLYRPVPNDD